MSAAESADVGAVVIGRNEGERLKHCLASLAGRAARVVYVDSGSTDGSVAAARESGAEVVSLDMSAPFTAARARNAGLEALCAGDAAGDLVFVQFVDGDCEIEPGWIAAARARLSAEPDTAVVCGRRAERFPDATVFNRLCDMEWNTPVGAARACGGDALMRIAAVRAAGGFDPTLIAGEEPDLCFRLRRAGWRIWRIDAPMTRHDAAMTRVSQWWRRAIRGGWAYAEGADRHGRSAERYNVSALRSVLIWGLTGPFVLAAAVAAAPGAALWLLAAGVGVYGAMAVRIARRRMAAFGDPPRHAAAYAVFTMLGKIPQAIGALRYVAHRLRRRGPARLIEYK